MTDKLSKSIKEQAANVPILWKLKMFMEYHPANRCAFELTMVHLPLLDVIVRYASCLAPEKSDSLESVTRS